MFGVSFCFSRKRFVAVLHLGQGITVGAVAGSHAEVFTVAVFV